MNKRILLIVLAVTVSGFSQVADETGLVPISERLQDNYASTKPQGFLIDPQQLLRGGEARDRRDFLTYHSSDSLIDLYVVLFKGDQLLFNSSELSGHLLNSRSDSKPAVIIHYYMGRPERAEMFLSEALIEAVPLAEQGRALANAIERAKSGVSPLDELEKFMVQTSIRIYRMERLLSEGTASPAPLMIGGAEEPEAQEEEGQAVIQQLLGFCKEQKLKLVLGVALMAALYLLLRLHKQHASYSFPDGESQERLGGAHGAGVGAVIEFGKSSPPPAAQLEKLKLH